MKRSPLLILAFTLFIDMLGFGLILPLLPVYITHYGGKPWVGGALLACFSMMQFLFSPIWGQASDRHGRRPLILLSLSGSAITYFFFGLAPNLWVLFAARVASGILTAASMPTAQAYIADVTTPEKRASGMAVLGAAFGLGFAFGPAIGGVLSRYSLFGLPALATPALCAAGMALVNWVWAFMMLPESHTDRQPTQEKRSPLDVFPKIVIAMRQPAVSAPIMVFAFATFAFVAVESSFSWLVLLRFNPALVAMARETWQQYQHLAYAALPPDVHHIIPIGDWRAYVSKPFDAIPAALRQDLIERSETAVTSGIFAIVGITVLFTQGAVMGGLARRVGEHRMVVFGSLLLTAALLGIALAPTLTAIRLLSVCIAMGSGVLNPALNALITHAAGPAERGTLSGAQQGLGSLSRIIAPPINNYIVEIHTWIPFVTSSLIMAVAFVLSLGLRPLPHLARPAERTPEPAEV